MARTSGSSTSASTTPMILTPDSTGTSAPGFLSDSVPSSPNPAGVRSNTSSPGQGDQGQGQGQGQQDQGQGQGTSTGTGVATKRRPTAFYPNIKSTTRTLKPFSRSAAKRESVLALGSIEHLQHYFTKTGLVAKRDPLDKPHYGLVPAIGRAAYIGTSTSTSPTTAENSSPDTSALPSPPDLILPPSPELPLPRRPSYLPNPNQPKTYETDPESLIPGVIDDLNAVSRAWVIDKDENHQDTVVSNDSEPIVTVSAYDTNPPVKRSTGPVDVLDLLKTTTRAIRSTRNYLVSLPDESTLSPVTARPRFRPTVLSPPEKSQPKSPHSASPVTKSRGRDKDRDKHRDTERSETSHEQGVENDKDKAEEDPTTLVRKSALEVLAALREVEERYRLPLSDEAYDAQSDGGGGSNSGTLHRHHHGARTQSPTSDSESDFLLDGRHHTHLSQSMHEGDLSVTYSLMPIQVGDRLEHVPVWEDEESESDWEEETVKRELWDERLVLGSGWLYQQDVKMGEMEREREVVSRYLDVVDRVIFGRRGEHGGHRHGAREEDDSEWREGKGVRKERAWERERKRILTKNLRSRSRERRRVSGGMMDGSPTAGETQSIAMVLEQGRRVSTGGVDLPSPLGMVEEPEEMASPAVGMRSVSTGNISGIGGFGSIMEGARDEEGEEGEESESVDDDDLPEWAKRGTYSGDDLRRAYAFLRAFLPSHLASRLSPPDSRTEFLQSLTSGQLLCVAYNTCVRKSRKPWGYVSKDSIHDIIALERAQAEAERGGDDGEGKGSEGRRKGWTFRRTDNLRLWVGALKLRYLLPIQTPSQPLTQSSLNSLKLLGQLQSSLSTGSAASGGLQAHLHSLSHANQCASPSHTPMGLSPTKTRFASMDEPPIEFDARVVARKEDGWKDMLEKVLVRWMWKAVDEKRSLR